MKGPTVTVMFDTLRFARTLRDNGRFTPEQAEGLSDAFADAMAGEVVGRGDLRATETVLQDEIVAVRTELKDEIAGLRTEPHDSIASVRGEIAELHDSIAAVRGELRDSIAAVRGEIAAVRIDLKGLEARIEAARSDTIKRAVGIGGFQTVTIIGAAVVLARYLGH